MHRYVFAFLVAAVFLAPVPARADFSDAAEPVLTAGELLAQCGSRYNTDYGLCAGYVSAVADQLLAEGVDGQRVCTYGNARSQQFVDLVQSYAAQNPAYAHIPARALVAAALLRAFPCAR